MKNKIFDSHAHYDDDGFDIDRESLLLGMKEAGVGTIVNIGSSMESLRTTLDFVDQYDFMYGALGIHPCNTDELNEVNFQFIKEKLQHPKIKAVGEIGLDYYWDEPERKIQKEWFFRQLQLAKEVNMPVVIHSREAAADTLSIMKEKEFENLTGVIHCYSYGKEMAREFLNMDYSFGIGGVITFQNGKKLKEVVEYIPIEKILLETDCPYLSPVPFRGKRNSSMNLPYVINEIAKIKNISSEEVIRVTEENGKRLYRM
ncbi:MAG: TatD family hydrolase [Eubacteriales bacterium]